MIVHTGCPDERKPIVLLQEGKKRPDQNGKVSFIMSSVYYQH